jgi:cytoskeletal protein CcmA (bactofilin family)
MAPDTHESPASDRLVPEGGRFEGRVFSRRQATIDGEVIGPIEARGLLIVGPDARIEGALVVDALELAGRVKGDVLARERAVLVEGATLRGTLQSPRVRVAEGARLDGSCRIGPVDSDGESGTESA